MGITRHFPIFIIVTPIIAAVIILGTAEWKRRPALAIAACTLTASLGMSAALIPEVLTNGHISYYMSSWAPPLGIEIKIDFLGLFMMLLVAAVSLITVIYSRRYIPHEINSDKIPTYYSLFLLLAGSMLGISATSDIFNLFVFIEIMAITSYALVAISGSRPAVKASFKYLLMGFPSSILVLLAITFLYSVTGTLNMSDLTVKIAANGYPQIVVIAYGVFVAGFAVKAALFPLHQWLPDAHSIAPSPISALLSGLVVKMGVLGILRLTYSIYTIHALPGVNEINSLLAYTGASAIVYGSFMAIKQKELKRMVAYSTVAHIGYIIVGAGLMNKAGLTGGIYHILDHSLAKACFFLVAGSIIYKSGYREIGELKGAAGKMPFSCAAFALASFSVVGIPPSAGFVSKWYLLLGSLSAGNAFFGTVILLGSIMAAWYCFKIVYYMFFLPPENGTWQKIDGDAPLSMVGACWVLAAATLFLGIFAYLILPSLEKAIELLI